MFLRFKDAVWIRVSRSRLNQRDSGADSIFSARNQQRSLKARNAEKILYFSIIAFI